MMFLKPRTKIIFVFIVSFMATYVVMTTILSQLHKRDELHHKQAATVIQQEINERFNLFLDVAFVVGQISSVHITDERKGDQVSYEELIEKILHEKEYILGVNQLNNQGKIIRIFPQINNREAMHKVTQHFNELTKSFERSDRYWFSPPFKLFQEGYGFVFYIPVEKNKNLKGWIATVISSQKFFERFKSIAYFNDYDLVVRDDKTGGIYFSTAISPEAQKVQEVKSKIRGREITFQSWPKAANTKKNVSFAWQFLICLIIGIGSALVMKVYLQKKKAYARLENISDLLKLTSTEALTKLMDIQSEYLLIGTTGFLSTTVVEKDVQSVTNLIEQIELLQNIAGSEQLDEETFDILPVLEEHLLELQDVVKKKSINLTLESESFRDIQVTGNKWLISNTVLKNSLSYCVLISKPETSIIISHTTKPGECCTIFHMNNVYEEEMHKAFKIERRLLVARNVMGLLNGDITATKTGPEGLILKLTLRS